MLSITPTTGIKLSKKTGNNPTGAEQSDSLNIVILYTGQAIISDRTDSSSTAITPYGMSSMQGYELHIDNDALSTPIPKKDVNYLEVAFCETEMHTEKDYNPNNNIVLRVIDVFKPNKIMLNYTTLICDI